MKNNFLVNREHIVFRRANEKDNSKVEVVSFLRKKGEYYPQEFSKKGAK